VPTTPPGVVALSFPAMKTTPQCAVAPVTIPTFCAKGLAPMSFPTPAPQQTTVLVGRFAVWLVNAASAQRERIGGSWSWNEVTPITCLDAPVARRPGASSLAGGSLVFLRHPNLRSGGGLSSFSAMPLCCLSRACWSSQARRFAASEIGNPCGRTLEMQLRAESSMPRAGCQVR
jgi:hypothetical protein